MSMDKGLLTKDILYRFKDELNEQNYNKIIDYYKDEEDRDNAVLVILSYRLTMQIQLYNARYYGKIF